MTPTPKDPVDALMKLVDDYASATHAFRRDLSNPHQVEHDQYVLRATRAAVEASARALAAVPAGFVLVPVEPTQEMIDTVASEYLADHGYDDEWIRHAWASMLRRAAPSPSAVPTVEQAIVHLVEALAQSKGWLHAYADARVRDAIDGGAVQPLSEAQRVPISDACFVEMIEAAGYKTWDSRMWELKRKIEARHGVEAGIVTPKEPT